ISRASTDGLTAESSDLDSQLSVLTTIRFVYLRPVILRRANDMTDLSGSRVISCYLETTRAATLTG
ncbi:MAG: hypothetical protein ACK50J_04360, partial [Planctomyces sp.]